MVELDVTSLRLRWPRDLFLEQAQELLDEPFSARGPWLLSRAFVGNDALTSGLEDGDDSVLTALIARIDDLRYEYEVRPLFSERQGRARERQPPGYVWAKREFAAMMGRYYRTGCLGEQLQPSCPDDQTDDGDPSSELFRLTGIESLWPLEFSLPELDDDVFFDTLEALHELVVLPRDRRHHGYAGCSWHYRDFSHYLGTRVYRFQVNQLLSFASVPYRLAETGEDVGRVIVAFADPFDALVDQMLDRAEPAEGHEVRHAISLFRTRGASREEKRSAVAALARVLEQQRKFLKQHLLSKDEDALFQIANEFDIRHSNERQRVGYDDVFLDWTFWWYISTIELCDQLLKRGRN